MSDIGNEGLPVEAPVTVVEPVTPAGDPAAVVAPVAEEVSALRPHTEMPGLLDEGTPAASAVTEVPAEAAAGGGDDPDQAPPGAVDPATEPAIVTEPMVYEALALPEGVTFDVERLGVFDRIIGTHRLPAEARQELVDMHLAERAAWDSQTLQNQHDAFIDMRKAWQKKTMADEEVGGAAWETSRAAAGRMIRLFTTEKNREPFMDMLRATGTIDHPEMARFLVNVARKFDEPAPPPGPRNPPPDIGRRPGARQMRGFYDHERSQQQG